jgi:short-subunit dehydrogenase
MRMLRCALPLILDPDPDLERSMLSRPIALITGASSGLGKALAENFAEAGYDVILTARDGVKLAAVAADLQNRVRITATVIVADLAAPAGPTELHTEIKRRGLSLSALVNNAGYGTYGVFQDTALDRELTMMQVNMDAVVSLTKLFLPDLLASRGKILNMSSTAAFQPGPYMGVYYATKAFVLYFSEALAAELADTGVTVTAVCPGPTASGFQDRAEMNHSKFVYGKTLPTSEAIARKCFRAFQRGQRVYVPGFKNWFLSLVPRFAPRRLVTWIVMLVSRPVE